MAPPPFLNSARTPAGNTGFDFGAALPGTCRRAGADSCEFAVLAARKSLGGAQQLADQGFGQHQLGLVEIAHGEFRRLFLVRAGVGPLKRHDAVAALALDGADDPAKTLAPAFMGEGQFDPGLLADRPEKVGGAHQGAIEARRGDLQPIGLADRILDIDHRRQSVVDFLAFVDGQRTVGPLGHDLDDRPLPAHDLDPHEAKAHRVQHTLGNRGDPRGHAGLRDETRLVERSVRILDGRVECLANVGVCVLRGVQICVRSVPGKTKKSGSRQGPTPAQALAGHDEDVDCRLYSPIAGRAQARRIAGSPPNGGAANKNGRRPQCHLPKTARGSILS